jgi:hypothetical protein
MSISELFDVPDPPMLVETLLPMKTLTGLSSFPGVGKTWLSLELARAVATGTKFLGKHQARMGNVVFVGQDASVHDYGRQLRKLCLAEYTKYEEEVAAGQRLINPFRDHIHFIVRAGIAFENMESMKRLAGTLMTMQHSEDVTVPHEGGVPEHTTSTGVDLIVFDTLSALTRCSQVDNTMMEYVYRNIRWLADVTGAGIVLLHHNSYANEHNDGERWRGAGSQEAALDNWFQLVRVPQGYVRRNGVHTYRILLKIKRFRGLTPEPFHYKLVVDDMTAKVEYEESHDDTVPQNVRDAIMGALDVTEFRTSNAITDLIWPQADLLGVIGLTKDDLLHSVRAVMKEATDKTVERGAGGFRIKGAPDARH